MHAEGFLTLFRDQQLTRAATLVGFRSEKRKTPNVRYERKISTTENRGVFAISKQRRSHNKQANYRISFKLITKKKVSTT